MPIQFPNLHDKMINYWSHPMYVCGIKQECVNCRTIVSKSFFLIFSLFLQLNFHTEQNPLTPNPSSSDDILKAHSDKFVNILFLIWFVEFRSWIHTSILIQIKQKKMNGWMEFRFLQFFLTNDYFSWKLNKYIQNPPKKKKI